MSELWDVVARIVSRLWHQGKTIAITDRILPLVEAAQEFVDGGHEDHCMAQHGGEYECTCNYEDFKAALAHFMGGKDDSRTT